jgi:outer membrane lipoprotein
MKRSFLTGVVLLALFSCSPVLNRVVMKEGAREFSLANLQETPEVFRGKLFILGGLIVQTRLTDTGSQIEALSVPVDSLGYLRESEHTQGRFLAVYPKSKGVLDPMVYKKGREVTLAGEFVEARKGKIDEMEYVYPVFEIREIYLWDERRGYYGPNYYYPYYDPFDCRSPFMYDPWGLPYGNPYWLQPW